MSHPVLSPVHAWTYARFQTVVTALGTPTIIFMDGSGLFTAVAVGEGVNVIFEAETKPTTFDTDYPGAIEVDWIDPSH